MYKLDRFFSTRIHHEIDQLSEIDYKVHGIKRETATGNYIYLYVL